MAVRAAILLWRLVIAAAVAVCLTVLLAAGCAGPQRSRPRQPDAEIVVWRTAYNERNRAPTVSWVTGSALTCARGTGWEYADNCVSGQFDASTWAAAVAWPAGNTSFAPTAYAHELLHAHLYATTGDPDNDHVRAEWSTLLPATNAALTKAGL